MRRSNPVLKETMGLGRPDHDPPMRGGSCELTEQAHAIVQDAGVARRLPVDAPLSLPSFMPRGRVPRCELDPWVVAGFEIAPMDATGVPALHDAIRRLHGRDATWRFHGVLG
jgi:hypothetical protein